MRTPKTVLLLIMLLPAASIAQNDVSDTMYNNISDKSLQSLNDKYTKLTSAVNYQTAKLLERMQCRETKLQKKLQGIDSSKAAELFGNTQAKYQQLQAELQSPINPNVANLLREYLPGVDSIQTAFRFLNQAGISPDKLQQIQGITTQIQQLQGSLQKANDIQVFLKEREQQLKDQLSQYNFGGKLLGMNKQLYYYQQQIAQYKALLHDPQKLEETVLSTISNMPAFQSFFQKNSYLSQLFGIPGNYGTLASIAGLQTRAQVQQLIGQRIGNVTLPGGGGSQPMVQQQIQGAQQQLSSLQNKVSALGGAGGGNSDAVMPDFKPNPEKTKTFFKRLEYGFNIQTTQATIITPSISDIALTVGYKFSDRATMGIGASYKLGFGRPINHIKFTSEGAGFRSYIDVKAKKSFWLSGGLECNYMQSFSKLSDLNQNITAWQKSALLGLTKKYKIGKTKEGNLQLLYDFLSKQHIPVSQPLIFRMGYSL